MVMVAVAVAVLFSWCLGRAIAAAATPPYNARGLLSPRMDYDEWTPLGRGDPLKNDPTYDYVPPVLDRVNYWLEPEERTPDPPPTTPNALLMLAKPEVKKPPLSPMLDRKHSLIRVRPQLIRVGYQRPPSTMLMPPEPQTEITTYGTPTTTLKAVPVTMNTHSSGMPPQSQMLLTSQTPSPTLSPSLVPPPPQMIQEALKPSESTIAESTLHTASEMTEQSKTPPTEETSTLLSTTREPTDITTLPTSQPTTHQQQTTLEQLTQIFQHSTMEQPTTHQHSTMEQPTTHQHSTMEQQTLHQHSTMEQQTLHQHSTMEQPTSHQTTMDDSTQQFQSTMALPTSLHLPHSTVQTPPKNHFQHTTMEQIPSQTFIIKQRPQPISRNPSSQMESFPASLLQILLQDEPLPTTTTTPRPSLTPDPIFSQFKPAEPVRGPMYLIIQGHSKVKTYGAANLDQLPGLQGHDDNEVDHHRRKRQVDLDDFLPVDETLRVVLKDYIDDGTPEGSGLWAVINS